MLTELRPLPDTLNWFHCRAQRLIAFDLQNQELIDSSRSVLSASLQQLLSAPIEGSAYAYELSYHHNLLSIANERLFAYEAAMTHSRRALELCLANGFVTDAAAEYANQAKIFSTLDRQLESIAAADRAKRIVDSAGTCFRTVVDQSGVMFIPYAQALGQIAYAGELQSIGQAVRAGEMLAAAADNIDQSEQLLDALGHPQAIHIKGFLARQRVNILLNSAGSKEATSSVNADREFGHLLELAESGTLGYFLLEVQHLRYQQISGEAMAPTSAPTYRSVLSYLDTLNWQKKEWPSTTCLQLAELALLMGELEHDAACPADKARVEQLAHDHALLSISLFEQYLIKLDRERDRTIFSGDKSGKFSRAVRILLPENEEWSETIFSLVDQAKVAGLRTALERQRLFLGEDGQSYIELYRKAMDLRIRLASSPNGRSAVRVETERRRFFEDLDIEERNIATQLFSEPYGTRSLGSLRLQKELKNGQLLVDYFLIPGSIVVNIVSAGRRKQIVLPVSDKFSEVIAGYASGDLRSEATLPHLRDSLTRWMIEPVREWIDTDEEFIDHWIISGSKQLMSLPFNRLKLKNGNGREEYLMDRFVVSYAHGATALVLAREIRQQRARLPERAGFFLATSPIAGSRGHLAGLPLLRDSLELLQRRYFPESPSWSEVSPKIFQAEGARFRYCYLAAHGREASDGADQYYLQLTPSPDDEPGRLTPLDIYALSLSTDLFFALNCRSAEGSTFDFEGRRSIGRALQFAGASAVISGHGLLRENGLAELLSLFHYAWVEEGNSAARSLTLAQRAFRARHPAADPAQWAGLIYYGDPEIYYAE